MTVLPDKEHVFIWYHFSHILGLLVSSVMHLVRKASPYASFSEWPLLAQGLMFMWNSRQSTWEWKVQRLG